METQQIAFTVYRDGRPDPAWVRRIWARKAKTLPARGIRALHRTIWAALCAVGRKIDRWLLAREIRAFDAKYGTTFAAQLAKREDDRRKAAFAKRIGL